MEDGFFDVLAGYSDADLETAEFERLGRKSAAARARGQCPHGWRQSYTPTHRPDLKPGQSECHDCGKIATDIELDAERAEALS